MRLDILPRSATLAPTAGAIDATSETSHRTQPTPSGSSSWRRSSRRAIAVTDIRGARRSASALPMPLEAPTIRACPEPSAISGRERGPSQGDDIVRGLRFPDAAEIGAGTDLLEQVDHGKDRKRIPLARLAKILPALQRLVPLERPG